jgi:hypothetical protein
VAKGESTGLSADKGSENSAVNATRETKAVSFDTRIHDLTSATSFYQRSRAMAGIADGMDVAQVRQALEELKTRSIRDADQIRLRLIERWAELEPEAALRYAETLSQGSDAQYAIAAVIGTWGANNAKAAEDAVERMADGFPKSIARAAMVSVLAASNPHRAFALLEQSRPFYENITALFGTWAERNPDEAAAHALKLRADWQQSLALKIVAEKWNKSDRDGALAWAQSLPSIPGEGVTIERRDPKPLAAVLKTWFSEDAESALRWLEQQPDSAMKTDVLGVLSKDLGSENPQQAVEAASMMPAGKAQESALRNLIREWGESDFDGALDWAQQHTDQRIRNSLLPPLVDQLASRDPHAALDIAQTLEGESQTRSVSGVLRAWAGKEPEAAAEWASAQPENDKLLSSVAWSWAQTNRERALEWATSLPEGPAKDAALTGGVRMIAQSEQPLLTLPWITSIGSEDKRARAYEELASWWLRSDPAKARAWLETAPIPAPKKADLLKNVAK